MEGNLRQMQIDFVSDNCAVQNKNIKDCSRIASMGHLFIQLLFDEHLLMARPLFMC